MEIEKKISLHKTNVPPLSEKMSGLLGKNAYLK